MHTSQEFNVEESNIRLVGGTFTFKGVNSPVQHMLLSKLLRLSIYVHLSLLLEQHLLSDSRVPIKFPQPVSTHFPSSPATPQPTLTKPRPRNSIFPSSFVNGFLKRSFSTRQKTTISGAISETPVEAEAVPRKHFDGRLHRFSFIGEKKVSTGKPNQPLLQRKPFEATLRRVEDNVSLLSTSTGVRFKPPKILVDLADKEKTTESRQLMADERIALSSLLGWDGKDAEGRGMSGILGFVRYQNLSVLHSQHIPPLPLEGSSGFTISSSTLPTSGLSNCGKSYWMTYCYYSSGDKLLGDMINDLARNVNLPCERPGCLFTRGQHESRIIHGGTRIVIRTNGDVVEDSADSLIQMWQSCAVCEARTPRTNMHDGTLYVPVIFYLKDFTL
jgi:1-phosphatidylinositol-3-phosphate 5-kinase